MNGMYVPSLSLPFQILTQPFKAFIKSDRDLNWEFLQTLTLNVSLCRWEHQGRPLWATEAQNLLAACLAHSPNLPEPIDCIKAVLENINNAAAASFSNMFLRLGTTFQLFF